MKSYALHTDLYQINMAYSFFKDNIHEKKAVFEVFFRKNPFSNGYVVFAGLERVVEFINHFKFSEEDLEFIKTLDYDDDFIEYLSNLRFSGNIRSVIEGEIVFAKEAIMIVETNLIEAQLIETALLNIINYQTLIATKASRIKNIAKDKTLLEFGARRAQEMDAAIWGTRAAYISGFDGTSLVSAGKQFNIPIVGTHAHSFVQVYQDEYTAFKKYAQTHHKCTFLVDTYDTLKSGIVNAIKVADELNLGNERFSAIRIDSGDLAYHSNKAREMLDKAGYTDTKIIVSNDLDEDLIASLLLEKAAIDGFGIGTKLITSYSQPALGAVYKLVAIEREEGLVDVIKISSNKEKITSPGIKNVYRVINKETNKAEGDYMAKFDEVIDTSKPLRLYNEENPFEYKEIEDYKLFNILKTIYQDGKLIYELPDIEQIRTYHKKALSYLWNEHKRYRYPARYFVNFSEKLYMSKLDLIEKYKSK